MREVHFCYVPCSDLFHQAFVYMSQYKCFSRLNFVCQFFQNYFIFLPSFSLTTIIKVDGAVKTLLTLKAEYKSCTGKDWKPSAAPAAKPASAAKPSAPAVADLTGKPAEIDAKIKVQGEKVRELKAAKAAKPEVEGAVKALLELKSEFKAETGYTCIPFYLKNSLNNSVRFSGLKGCPKGGLDFAKMGIL